MERERRSGRVPRATSLGDVAITTVEGVGRSRRIIGRAADYSEFGLGLTVPTSLEVGAPVHIDGTIETVSGRRGVHSDAQVRWCVAIDGGRYRVGLLLQDQREEQKSSSETACEDGEYYELLQLSPNADLDTVHRVFRILAARYHPDNAETGNGELFRKLVEAHRVLSDPERRAAYDAAYRANNQVKWRIFDDVSVTMGSEAEKRKRSGMLSVLYAKRMQQPDHPGLSLREMEELLGCPKEHLEFTVWYLKESGMIMRGDNGRYQITIKGVDAAESQTIVMRDGSHLLAAGRPA